MTMFPDDFDGMMQAAAKQFPEIRQFYLDGGWANPYSDGGEVEVRLHNGDTRQFTLARTATRTEFLGAVEAALKA